jgi:hypothetical protein
MVRKNAIEGRPIASIAQPNTAAHNIRLIVSSVLHDFQKVEDRFARLLHNAVDQLAIHHSDLARDIQPSIGLDRMRERHTLIGNSLASVSSVPFYHRLTSEEKLRLAAISRQCRARRLTSRRVSNTSRRRRYAWANGSPRLTKRGSGDGG